MLKLRIILAAQQKEGEKLKLPSTTDLHKRLVAEVKSESENAIKKPRLCLS